MSLYIVGSVSRVTSHIIKQLAANKLYSSITVGDLLPSYHFHQRYYRLQQDLENLQLNQTLKLQKIHQINDIYEASKQNDDILYVTHDYYQHVASKTKIMEFTAQACKKRNNVIFATPIEYDHFGFQNPQQNYQKSQENVKNITQNATIIRSDIQDKTQLMAYLNSSKGFLQGHIFNHYSSPSFYPKVVSSEHYARVVVEALKNKLAGKTILVSGKQHQRANEVQYELGVQEHEYNHSKINMAELTSKYRGIEKDSYERMQVSE